jgi:hypothetical protein
MSRRLTTEEFIARSITVHGERYGYTKTHYINNHTKILIDCPIHGEFSQTSAAHIRQKQGCPKCGSLNSIRSRSLTTQEFVERAKKIQDGKYDYTKVKYLNSTSKIIIICPIHGDFLQRPLNHLSGEGCSKCRYANNTILLSKSTPHFIQECREIHGNAYDYSLSKYIQANTKITILCPRHGPFLQTPHHHLHGDGCPKCFKRISKKETDFLDHMGIPDRQVYLEGKQVDGYDSKANTIYEFLGDYWHGNPVKFNPDDYNKTCKTTFGILHHETLKKFDMFVRRGYTVRYVWESDWKNFIHKKDPTPKILEYHEPNCQLR